MKLFIQDVRKEYRVPDMPFIIGVLGTSQAEERVAKTLFLSPNVKLPKRLNSKATSWRLKAIQSMRSIH